MSGCPEDAITLQGFAYILKGIKAQNAATVIERRAREHATSRKKSKKKVAVSVSSGSGAGAGSGGMGAESAGGMGSVASEEAGATVAISDEVARIEFERRLGDALSANGTAPRELVLAWDRKHKGAISRVEFRVGVREDLGRAFARLQRACWPWH